MRSDLFKTLLVVTSAWAFASPALASGHTTIVDHGGGSKTARINFADLDLSSTDGQRELDRRVSDGIRKVCRAPAELWAVTQACRKAAQTQAKPQLFAAVQRAQTRLAMVSPSR